MQRNGKPSPGGGGGGRRGAEYHILAQAQTRCILQHKMQILLFLFYSVESYVVVYMRLNVYCNICLCLPRSVRADQQCWRLRLWRVRLADLGPDQPSGGGERVQIGRSGTRSTVRWR